MLEAIEAKKLNDPLKTKTTAAKAKRVVHDAVKRVKIILFPFQLDDTLYWKCRRHHLHASNAASITPVAPREPPLAVILMEEVAKEAYIGSSDEAQEGEYKGVDRDHFLIWSLGVWWLWLGSWSVTLDTRF